MEQQDLYLDLNMDLTSLSEEDFYVYRSEIPKNVSYADGITVNSIKLETYN